MVKSKISGPAAVGIVVVVSAVIIGFLYMQFFHEKKASPQDMKAGMDRGMMANQMKQRYESSQNRGGQSGPPPGAPR
jgi:hypothetical protein